MEGLDPGVARLPGPCAMGAVTLSAHSGVSGLDEKPEKVRFQRSWSLTSRGVQSFIVELRTRHAVPSHKISSGRVASRPSRFFGLWHLGPGFERKWSGALPAVTVGRSARVRTGWVGIDLLHSMVEAEVGAGPSTVGVVLKGLVKWFEWVWAPGGVGVIQLAFVYRERVTFPGLLFKGP